MSTRKALLVVLVVGAVAIVATTLGSLRTTEAFDQQFVKLLDDMQAELLRAQTERDLIDGFYTWLDGEGRRRVNDLPDSEQQFQIILKRRLKTIIEGSVELRQKDPLETSTSQFLTSMLIELNDIRAAHREGEGYRSPY